MGLSFVFSCLRCQRDVFCCCYIKRKRFNQFRVPHVRNSFIYFCYHYHNVTLIRFVIFFILAVRAITDLKPGMVVKCKVAKIFPFQLNVSLGLHIRGLLCIQLMLSATALNNRFFPPGRLHINEVADNLEQLNGAMPFEKYKVRPFIVFSICHRLVITTVCY